MYEGLNNYNHTLMIYSYINIRLFSSTTLYSSKFIFALLNSKLCMLLRQDLSTQHKLAWHSLPSASAS